MRRHRDAYRARQTLRQQLAHINPLRKRPAKITVQDDRAQPFDVLNRQRIKQAVFVPQSVGRFFRLLFRRAAQGNQFLLVHIGKIARGNLNNSECHYCDDDQNENGRQKALYNESKHMWLALVRRNKSAMITQV